MYFSQLYGVLRGDTNIVTNPAMATTREIKGNTTTNKYDAPRPWLDAIKPQIAIIGPAADAKDANICNRTMLPD